METNRALWRAVFDLYDWNHLMPDTEESWTNFLRAADEISLNFDYANNPLTKCLLHAVVEAVTQELNLRKNPPSAQASPQQLTFI